MLNSNDTFDVMNRLCPICKDTLKTKEVLEKYPRSFGVQFPYKTKRYLKKVKLSGCNGNHIFILHLKRVKRKDRDSGNAGFEVEVASNC